MKIYRRHQAALVFVNVQAMTCCVPDTSTKHPGNNDLPRVDSRKGRIGSHSVSLRQSHNPHTEGSINSTWPRSNGNHASHLFQHVFFSRASLIVSISISFLCCQFFACKIICPKKRRDRTLDGILVVK